jgi:A/G-specific adenine glycosylase
MTQDPNQKYFVKSLIRWNRDENTREMPWKGEKDPYKIWLSEIILQQTRVAQGLDYYHRFIAAFPTIHHLAKAPELKVFKLWEGLGYYTRCKNLIVTAKYISKNLNGKFPDQYQAILSLKGIGPYTAAAIGSFAFGLPYAVVDGNVFRVLSRYFGISTPIDSLEGKKLFGNLANQLLNKQQPAEYNQAMMDFGAVVCKPKLPLCDSCGLNKHCEAYLKGVVQLLPIKEKTIIKKTRWLYYLQIDYKGNTYVRKRGANDIWENLYELVLVESAGPVELSNLTLFKKLIGKNKFKLIHISPVYKQLLTHLTIYGQFVKITVNDPIEIKGYQKVGKKAFAGLPFPKFISNYLTDKNVPLNLF